MLRFDSLQWTIVGALGASVLLFLGDLLAWWVTNDFGFVLAGGLALAALVCLGWLYYMEVH